MATASITTVAPDEALAGADVQALVLSHASIATGDIINFVMERNTAEGIQLESFTAS
ncbi:hypothetical protein GIV17_19170, partial [Pseudomonas syringae]|nr:hypothetical protein [Pseudomonas syringae]